MTTIPATPKKLRRGSPLYMTMEACSRVRRSFGRGGVVLLLGGLVSSVPYFSVTAFASDESPDVTSADYVQNGLVAHWDGIENAGRGVHDASARFWMDLTGNGHTLTNFLQALTWTEDNGLAMPSTGYEKAATTPSFSLQDCVSYEVVFKQTSSKNNSMVFCFGNFRGCFIFSDCKGIYLHSGAGATWVSESALELDKIHCAYASYQEGSATLSDSAEVDGVALTASSTSCSESSCSGSFGLGYKHSSLERTNRAFYGNIYAIRVYSRKLTAAEREWNRTLDAKRFIDSSTAWNPPSKVTPTVTVNGSGTVTPVTETAVGADIDLTATPASGYAFGYWSGDVPESVDATDPHLTFEATALATNLVANFQKIVYVATDGNDSNGGTSWKDAFATISAALTSCDSPHVQVGPGLFPSTAAITVDKASTIVGTTDGTIQTVVKLTGQAGAAFILKNANARLTNLAITTGMANGHGVCLYQGGLVDHCVITNCLAYQNNYQVLPCSEQACDPGAGALLYYGGCVRDSTISNCRSWCNSTRTYYGGGVQIVGNGLVDRCQILNCRLDNGSGGGVALRGGGILRNSLVSGCYLSSGANGLGVYITAGAVENCTSAGNYHASSTTATGLYASGGLLRNTIIWGNTNQAGTAPNSVWSSACATYCTSETLISGDGNRTTDPMFKDAAHGDYTLTLSDCVDAGIEMPWHEGAKDLKGDDRVIEGVVDLGCYEFKSSGLSVGIEVSNEGKTDLSAVVFSALLKGGSGDAVQYDWKITSSNGYTNNVSGTGDDYASVTRYLKAGVYAVTVKATSGALSAEGSSSTKVLSSNTYVAVGGTGEPPYAASAPGGDIQTVLAATADGGVIHLAAGFYVLPDTLSLIRPVRVESAGGATFYLFPKSASVQTSTIFLNHADAVLSGVTVSGYSEDRKTRPSQSNGMAHGITIGSNGGMVTNCVVEGVSGDSGGAGIVLSSGLVTDTIVRGCYLTSGGTIKYGGGVRIIGGTVDRCIISNNTAEASGIGIVYGGGVYLNGGKLENSIVAGNLSYQKGGGIENAGGTVVNCLVCRNASYLAGTGVCQDSGTLLNSTIADNITNAADVAGCSVAAGTVKNTIVWANAGTTQLSAPQSVLDDSSNCWNRDPCLRRKSGLHYSLALRA